MCQGVAVCEAEVVVLGAAVGMKARRSSGGAQPRIPGRSWNWASKVITRGYQRALGLRGTIWGRTLRFFAMAGDATWGAGGALFFELGCQGWLI